MKYQVTGEDENTFSVKNESGKEFKVAKKGLSKGVLEKISGMKVQSLSDGTVDGPLEPLDHATNTGNDYSNHLDNSEAQSISDTINPKPELQPSGASGDWSPPQTPAQPLPNAQSGSPVAMLNDPYGLMQKQIDMGMGAQKVITDSAKENADQISKSYKSYADTMAQQQAATEKNRSQIMDELTKVANTPYDANRVWADSGTGNKVAGAISILLGGLSAGLSGKSNPAMDILNNTIQRDMELQKQKNQGLWSLNMAKFKNEELADQATKLQLGAMLQGDLQRSAAMSGSAQSLAAAKMYGSQLYGSMVPTAMQLAQQRTMSQALKGGGIPVGGEPDYIMNNPEYQKKRIVINDRAFQTPSEKDAEDVRGMQTEIGPIRSLISQLSDLSGDPAALVPGSQVNQRAEQLRGALVYKLNKESGSTRISKESLGLMQSTFGNPTSFSEFMHGDAKNKQMLQNLDDEMDANYQNKVIGYPKYNTQPHGQK